MKTKQHYPYTITVDPGDLKACEMMGRRYGWSQFLGAFFWNAFDEEEITKPRTVHLREYEAWEILDACDEDDWLLPCLSPKSNLYRELMRLRDEVL